MGSNEAETNPFEESGDCDKTIGRPCGDIRDISYQDIATKLLNDNFLLTALELHAELVESGKELPKLRIFFSNPGNFEHTVAKSELYSASIPRSSSQATLDSLDLTRFSEDGERGVDERVAVLEFELRKAKETISALRTNLTVATESDTSMPDGTVAKGLVNDPVKPHEQRALNFLINEYLLYYGYKLTSITFADENENQDFEDWDDVGLNISKPIALLQLYRDYMRQSGLLKPPGVSVSCQTNQNKEDNDIDMTASENDNFAENLKVEVALLLKQIENLKKEKQDLQEKLWTAERLSENAAQCEEQTKRLHKVAKDNTQRDCEDGWTAVNPLDLRDLPQTNTEEDQISADIDWTSVTMSTPDPVKVPRSDSQSGSGSGSAYGASETRVLVIEDEDRISAETEWMPIGQCASHSVSHSKSKSTFMGGKLDSWHHGYERILPEDFGKEVFSSCTVNTLQLNDSYQHLSDSIVKVADLSGPVEGLMDTLLNVLGKTVLKLLPYVILNKREEIIPLLVALIRLHSESKERDVLLHQLFNLKKRPDEEERRIILAGLISVAQGMDAIIVENEVLPQCWEQINHKYVERRLLVAEACGILAPYVTGAIRNSLMLSMLQQMLSEDREDTVRAAVIRSTALIAAMSPDCDKYSQCEDLVISCTSDPSPHVLNVFTQTLLPVVAQWALTSGRLQSSLWNKLLNQLYQHLQVKAVESPQSPSVVISNPGLNFQSALNILCALTSTLPHLVMCVATVETVLSRISVDLPAPQSRVGFSELCCGLANPVVFHCGSASVGQIMASFDSLFKLNNFTSWPELIWISEKMLPAVVDALNYVIITQDELLNSFVTFFRFLCVGFGPLIVVQVIKPVFITKLKDLEQSLIEIAGSGQKSSWPSLSVLVVYLGGVLSLGQSEEDMEDLHSTLKRFLMALPLCSGHMSVKFGSAPIDGLRAAISSLCNINKENIHEAVLATLWEGVVSPRAPVRSATATLFSAVIGSVPELLISTRVAPALITLASDPDVSVKTAAIPTFGKLMMSTSTKEVKEKVCLQLQSVLSDPVTRDSHTLLLQLVATLGQVVSSCDAPFREDVILPQLAGLAAYTSQLQNLTRKLDLGVALTEAFSAAVYISLPASVLNSAVLPGLRYLDQISQQLQPVHRETILAMIREVEARSNALPLRQDERRSSRGLASATANMNQGVEDMRQRMSKMFHPKAMGNQPSLPNLFRKK